MAFIETTPPERAQGDLAELYERIAGARGGVAEVMAVQSLNPAAMAAHFDFYTTLLFGRSELDRRTREMIGVIVSATNNCAYCVEHHTAPLQAYRVDPELLAQLQQGLVPDANLSTAMVQLLDFARRLTSDPAPDPQAIEALRAAGWSDAAILDATLIVGYFNLVNRLVLGLGVQLEEGFEVTCQPELEAR